MLYFEALAEGPGADTHEGEAVAVPRVEVRLQLEDEAGEVGKALGMESAERRRADEVHDAPERSLSLRCARLGSGSNGQT